MQGYLLEVWEYHSDAKEYELVHKSKYRSYWVGKLAFDKAVERETDKYAGANREDYTREVSIDESDCGGSATALGVDEEWKVYLRKVTA
jgi:hypothetical protein